MLPLWRRRQKSCLRNRECCRFSSHRQFRGLWFQWCWRFSRNTHIIAEYAFPMQPQPLLRLLRDPHQGPADWRLFLLTKPKNVGKDFAHVFLSWHHQCCPFGGGGTKAASEIKNVAVSRATGNVWVYDSNNVGVFRGIHTLLHNMHSQCSHSHFCDFWGALTRARRIGDFSDLPNQRCLFFLRA